MCVRQACGRSRTVSKLGPELLDLEGTATRSCQDPRGCRYSRANTVAKYRPPIPPLDLRHTHASVLLHIADAVGQAIQHTGQRRVGLLGTRFTMEQTFYSDRLRDRFGIETIVPPAADREIVHTVIYQELCHGVIREESRAAFKNVIARLEEQGAESVILGCTEIGLLISEADSILPVHDSTKIHAVAAVEFALA